jgi:hypothetical protein
MRQWRAVAPLIPIGLAMLALLALPAPSRAQQSPAPQPKPVIERANILVNMSEDGNDTVEATYTVQNSAGLEGGVIEHVLARRPGAELGEIQATGAATGGPDVERHEGMTRVKVVASGDPATYTLRYAVRRAPDTFAVPILAPNIPVARSEPNVTIETTLPQGKNQQGEWFPSVDRFETRDGRTILIHRVINIPSVTIAEYGQGSWFSLSLLVTVVSFAILIPILVWWFSHALTPGRAASLSP